MVKTRATTKREKERNIERCMNKEIIEIEETGRPRKVLVISNVVENKESGNMEMNLKLPLEARQKEVNNQEIINVAYEHNQIDGKIGEINGDPVSTEEDNEVVSRMKTARDKLQHLLYVTQCQIQSVSALEFAVFAKLPYGETKLEPQFQGGIGMNPFLSVLHFLFLNLVGCYC